MSDHPTLSIDDAVSHSRRSFWMLLVIFVVLTLSAMLLSVHGSLTVFGINTMRFLPIFLAVCMGFAGGGLVSTKERQSAFKAVAADELRVQSMSTAYRIAFFAALIAQPVLALLGATMAVVHPIGFMAAGTLGLATISFLGSFLWLDR